MVNNSSSCSLSSVLYWGRSIALLQIFTGNIRVVEKGDLFKI